VQHAYNEAMSLKIIDDPVAHGRALLAGGAARRNAMSATGDPAKPASPEPAMPDGGDAVVVERQEKKTVPPPLYQVVLLNDDYTPMEFVVAVIEKFFNKDHETAVQIMLKVHLEGRGVCGVYTRDIAASKVDQVQAAAKKAGHPLVCLMEAA
jgi:ATP-dependent Clp protease adaptor protein ClpS